MTMRERDYDNERANICKANKQHLNDFRKWLESKKLSQKTIDNHVFNVDLYINEFLAYYAVQDIREGCYAINRFLGDYFIRKILWSRALHIKASAASIKKFYTCMLEKNVIEKADKEFLFETIKNSMNDWLAEMKAFDNLDEDDFLMW